MLPVRPIDGGALFAAAVLTASAPPLRPLRGGGREGGGGGGGGGGGRCDTPGKTAGRLPPSPARTISVVTPVSRDQSGHP